MDIEGSHPCFVLACFARPASQHQGTSASWTGHATPGLPARSSRITCVQLPREEKNNRSRPRPRPVSQLVYAPFPASRDVARFEETQEVLHAESSPEKLTPSKAGRIPSRALPRPLNAACVSTLAEMSRDIALSEGWLRRRLPTNPPLRLNTLVSCQMPRSGGGFSTPGRTSGE